VKKWKVLTLPDAEADIESIYSYIATILLEPVTAARLIARIRKAINSLGNMPGKYRLYDKEPWRSKGLRLFPVGNYIVFYHIVPDHDSVFIDAVIYGGRDVEAIAEGIRL
jgi:toxin ParE1/3/4